MDEHERIEAAIRASLESGLDTGVGGALAEIVEIASTTDVRYLRDDTIEVVIRHLEVADVDVDTAAANLDATLSVAAKHARSGAPVRWEVLVNGPVELRRSDGTWRIHDVSVDGLRVSETHQAGELAAGRTADDLVEGRLLAVLGSRRSASMYVDVDNRTGAAIRIPTAAAAVRRRLGIGWRWSLADHAAAELGPGTTRIQLATGVGRSRAARPVRVLLRTDRGIVDVRPQHTRARRRMPLTLRRPTLAWTVLVAAMAASLGWLTTWSLAGLLLFTISSAGVLALISSPELARSHPAFVLSRASAFLVGIGLFVWPYVFPAPVVDVSKAGDRLLELVEDRGVRLDGLGPQSEGAFVSAWSAFEEFGGVRVEDSGRPTHDLFVLRLRARQSNTVELVLQRNIFSAKVVATRLVVRVSGPEARRVLAGARLDRCQFASESCALYCTYRDGGRSGCHLEEGPGDAASSLREAMSSSFATGGTTDAEQRRSWMRYVERSFVFRRFAAVEPSSLHVEVPAQRLA